MFRLNKFTEYSMWEDSINLTDKTIELMDKNKHFNSFTMRYYKKLNSDYKQKVKSEGYYNYKIKNALFYNYNEDFFCLKYPKNKSLFGIRECSFLSYPMLALHNMIGIYLIKVTNLFLEEYIYKNENIQSFYGGNFRISGERIIYDEYDLYYYNFYKKYKKELAKELKKGKTEKTVVLRIDIEKYYESLPIKKMLDKIEKNVKLSKLREHCYDETTKATIAIFFEYLMNGKDGLPTIEHSSINSFIGYLYLCFAELEIIEKVKSRNKEIEEIKVVRYMDDMFFFIKFFEEDLVKKTEIIMKILIDIKEILFSEYDLKINKKTKCFDISLDEDIENFKKEIKVASVPTDLPLDTDKEKNPIQKYEDIRNNLIRLKESMEIPSKYLKFQNECDFSIFNEVYDKRVQQYLDKDEIQDDLKQTFAGISYKILKLIPKPLVVLMSKEKSGEAKNEIEKKILGLSNIKTDDIELAFELLAQDNFNNQDIINKISENQYFKSVIEKYNDSECKKIQLKYSDDNEYQKYTLISQIIMRKLALQKRNYSLALNHLVNELQLFCFYKDNEFRQPYEKYLLPLVKNLLEKKGIATSDIIKLDKLFDRRHINQISHSLSEEKYIEVLNLEEYNDFELSVERILTEIMSK